MAQFSSTPSIVSNAAHHLVRRKQAATVVSLTPIPASWRRFWSVIRFKQWLAV